MPFREPEKFASPAPAAVVRDWKACLGTSFHHGAASSLAAFQVFDREKADHDNDATYPLNDAVIGADNGWVDVTAEHYDALTGHLRG